MKIQSKYEIWANYPNSTLNDFRYASGFQSEEEAVDWIKENWEVRFAYMKVVEYRPSVVYRKDI